MLDYNNLLSAKEYCGLRSAVEWKPIVEDQARSGLDHSDFVIACRDNDEIVGCARIFWDKGYIAYLADVMVKPAYQKQDHSKRKGCNKPVRIHHGIFAVCSHKERHSKKVRT